MPERTRVLRPRLRPVLGYARRSARIACWIVSTWVFRYASILNHH